jgi:hypothetical protein
MSEALLVLCPDDPRYSPPSIEHLASCLTSVGLTGQAIGQGIYTRKHQYMTGEKFLELIAFLGCSPNIKLEPEKEHQSFCHINIVMNQGESILFRQGTQTTPPRCPKCRKPLRSWRSLIPPGELNDAVKWQCPDCSQNSTPWQFDWRKTAGFGRCFIEITDIYPKEALPQLTLLDTLKEHYATSWTWFYQF